MPKSDNQKLKIFYILDYLQRNSHADHPVRAAQLMEMLEKRHNIICERKTIYSDIAALQDLGIDIVSIPGKNGGYYIASRNFELPELKLLIDAVQSSSGSMMSRRRRSGDSLSIAFQNAEGRSNPFASMP